MAYSSIQREGVSGPLFLIRESVSMCEHGFYPTREAADEAADKRNRRVREAGGEFTRTGIVYGRQEALLRAHLARLLSAY